MISLCRYGQGMDSDKGCSLGAAQQMVTKITETIRREYSDEVSLIGHTTFLHCQHFHASVLP